jgi:hypothetical protein
MTLAEFIEQLKKYPQDMKISFGEDSDWSESVILIFGQAEKGETINHGYGYTSTNLIVKFDQYTEKITWSDPKTFKRNFDAHKLVDDMTGVIILKKNMTSADVLDAYLNGVHAIPIDLNKEMKNDIQSN